MKIIYFIFFALLSMNLFSQCSFQELLHDVDFGMKKYEVTVALSSKNNFTRLENGFLDGPTWVKNDFKNDVDSVLFSIAKYRIKSSECFFYSDVDLSMMFCDDKLISIRFDLRFKRNSFNQLLKLVNHYKNILSGQLPLARTLEYENKFSNEKIGEFFIYKSDPDDQTRKVYSINHIEKTQDKKTDVAYGKGDFQYYELYLDLKDLNETNLRDILQIEYFLN